MPIGLSTKHGKPVRKKLTPEFADRLTDSMERINQTTDPTQLQALIKKQAGKMPKWTEKNDI